jgi:hypothetical protein
MTRPLSSSSAPPSSVYRIRCCCLMSWFLIPLGKVTLAILTFGFFNHLSLHWIRRCCSCLWRLSWSNLTFPAIVHKGIHFMFFFKIWSFLEICALVPVCHTSVKLLETNNFPQTHKVAEKRQAGIRSKTKTTYILGNQHLLMFFPRPQITSIRHSGYAYST